MSTERRMAAIARAVRCEMQAAEVRDQAAKALDKTSLPPRPVRDSTRAINPLGVHALHFRLG